MNNKKRVLVVDDEPSILRFTRVSLKLAGFEVMTAGGGEEALHLIGTRPPDVLVLDILMTPVSGINVLDELRRFSTLPVIAFTASVTASSEAVKHGADDILIKPFQPEDLVQKINKLLCKT